MSGRNRMVWTGWAALAITGALAATWALTGNEPRRPGVVGSERQAAHGWQGTLSGTDAPIKPHDEAPALFMRHLQNAFARSQAEGLARLREMEPGDGQNAAVLALLEAGTIGHEAAFTVIREVKDPFWKGAMLGNLAAWMARTNDLEFLGLLDQIDPGTIRNQALSAFVAACRPDCGQVRQILAWAGETGLSEDATTLGNGLAVMLSGLEDAEMLGLAGDFRFTQDAVAEELASRRALDGGDPEMNWQALSSLDLPERALAAAFFGELAAVMDPEQAQSLVTAAWVPNAAKPAICREVAPRLLDAAPEQAIHWMSTLPTDGEIAATVGPILQFWVLGHSDLASRLITSMPESPGRSLLAKALSKQQIELGGDSAEGQ